MNTKQCGMKRLMEEAATQSAEAIHYSVSAGIRVGGEKAIRSGSNTGLKPLVLEGLFIMRLTKEEADRAEKRVQEGTGWDDSIEEKTGFVEAMCQNYEVMVEDKPVGQAEGSGPSNRYDTRSGQKRNDGGPTGPQEKERGKIPSFRLSSEIESCTDLRKVLE